MRRERLGRIVFGLAIIAFMVSTTYCDIEQNGRIKALEKKLEQKKGNYPKPAPISRPVSQAVERVGVR